MHICFASLDYPGNSSGGGVGTYVKNLALELRGKGHLVSVIALSGKNLGPYCGDDQGINIYWIRPGNIHWYISKVPGLGKKVDLAVREIEYSLAVFHAIKKIDQTLPIDIVEGTETGSFFLKWLRMGIKRVIRLHGEKYTYDKYTPPYKISKNVLLSRWLQRSAIRNCDLLTAPSAMHAHEIEIEVGLPQNSINVVLNPVNISPSSLLDGHNKFDDPTFLFIGRIERVKGVLELIKAIPNVLQKIPRAHFLFAGNYHPSIPKQDLVDLITKLSISSNVNFLGHLPKIELEKYYKKSWGVIVPSYYETFGYVYPEALSFGSPVISFQIGAANEFVNDGVNGFLVKKRNQKDLEDACIRLVNSQLQFKTQEYIEKCATPRIAEQILSHYLKVINVNDKKYCKTI